MEKINEILNSIDLESLNIKDLAILLDIVNSLKTNDNVEVI